MCPPSAGLKYIARYWSVHLPWFKQSSEGFYINKPHPQLEFLRNHVVRVQHCTVPEQREFQPDKEFSAHFSGASKSHTERSRCRKCRSCG